MHHRWKVSTPTVFVMKGAPTDNNATLFAQGYDAVSERRWLQHHVRFCEHRARERRYVDAFVALTDFEGAYAANPKINAVVTPNDENAAPIIAHLQAGGLKPRRLPVHGSRRHVWSVSRTSSLATSAARSTSRSGSRLRRRPRWRSTCVRSVKPPAGLVNGTTTDSQCDH